METTTETLDQNENANNFILLKDKQGQILVPLLVNEKMEIITGNKRLVAATTLNLPTAPRFYNYQKQNNKTKWK